MMAFVKVLAALALIFGATTGTVSASQESLPGSVFYPMKVGYEEVRLSLTQDSEAKALLAMAYAEERVDEAVQLTERGDEIPEPLAARYQIQVGLALQTMEGLGEAQQLQLRTHFSDTLQNQVRVMEQVMVRLHQGENNEPAQTMLRTMLQAQQALGNTGQHKGGNEIPGNDNEPGPNPNDNGNGQDNGKGQGNGGGQDNGGDNGSNGDQDKGNEQQYSGENANKPSDKGQNGEGGRRGESGNPDAGGNGEPNNGEPNNGGSDNGSNGEPNNDGSDNGGNSEPNNGGSGEGGDAGNGNGEAGGDGGNSDGNGGSGNGHGGGSGGGGGN